MKASGAIRVLKGVRTSLVPGNIKQIFKYGDRRIVVDNKGNRATVSRRKLKNAVDRVLTATYE